jgi:hypothetical protein
MLSACTTATSPSANLAGRWVENLTIPGASLVVTVDSNGNGSGTYSIEAGRSGTVQIIGAVQPAKLALTFRYDYGVTRTFVGALTDSNHLTGVFEDGAPVVFTRE